MVTVSAGDQGMLVTQLPAVYGTARKGAGLGVLERCQRKECSDIEGQVDWLVLLRLKFHKLERDNGEDCGVGKGT